MNINDVNPLSLHALFKTIMSLMQLISSNCYLNQVIAINEIECIPKHLLDDTVFTLKLAGMCTVS